VAAYRWERTNERTNEHGCSSLYSHYYTSYTEHPTQRATLTYNHLDVHRGGIELGGIQFGLGAEVLLGTGEKEEEEEEEEEEESNKKKQQKNKPNQAITSC
jgi:hypothetical protein